MPTVFWILVGVVIGAGLLYLGFYIWLLNNPPFR